MELSEWQALGDWRMFFLHRDRLKEVTVDDVIAVADRYLIESNRTSGVFTPVDEPLRAEIPETPDVAKLVEGYEGTETIAQGEDFEPTPENIEARTTREELDGIRLALLPKETRGDQVIARFSFHFGTEEAVTPHITGLSMLPGLLMRGTERLDYQALRDEIDRLQSSIQVYGGPGEFGASITSDRANFSASIALLGEILRTPAFPEDQFDLIKTQSLAGLEQSATDPMALGMRAAQRYLSPFPPESIHYVPTVEEDIARTEKVTLDELKTLHARFYGAGRAEISIVGDFDPETVKKDLAGALGGWTSDQPYERIARPYVAARAEQASIHTPDKEMAVVVTGASMKLRDDDPDFPALEFANYVLGQSAKSRLLTRLRHEGGLSYGAGSQFQVDDQDEASALFGYAICAPQNAFEAQEAMRAEIDRWIEAGITEAELTEGKQGFAANFANDLANDGYVARELLNGLETGRTFQYRAGVMQRIQELSLEDIATTLGRRFADVGRFELIAGDMDKAKVGE